MAKWGVTITGGAALTKKLRALNRKVPDLAVLAILLRGAKRFRDTARAMAPRGPTGNFRRGIVAKAFGRQIKGSPAAFCGIDFRYAPHAHLIEYGTGPRSHKSGKYVGVMPIQPFFRPAVHGQRRAVQLLIQRGLKELIEKAAR